MVAILGKSEVVDARQSTYRTYYSMLLLETVNASFTMSNAESWLVVDYERLARGL